jgi:uncharacterized protein YdeI (YjbR/CyaY-like superfamily)
VTATAVGRVLPGRVRRARASPAAYVRPRWFTELVTLTEHDPVAFATAAAWRAWLADHHASATGLWLKIAKKAAAEGTLSYAEALDEALCFGWIDAQTRGLDDDYWLKRFTPRKRDSRWSKINTQKAEALIAAGRMQPAGLAEIDRARADGRWTAAYAGPRSITVPDDLAAALAANPAAAEFFATLNSINRYAILYRIGTVKRPETRARKIAQYIEMLSEHKTLHP